MSAASELRAIFVVMLWDVRKLGRYKIFLAMRFGWFLVQVLVFGILISSMVSFGEIKVDYYKFYVLGAYVAILFSMAISRGLDVVDEFEDGLIDYHLSLPISRKALAVGRALGGGVSSFLYSFPMLLVALVVLGALPAVIIASALSLVFALGISSISITIALIVRSGDKLDVLMGISDAFLIRMSTLFYPIAALTSISAYYYFAKINPISHMADLLRLGVMPDFAEELATMPLGYMIAFILGFVLTSLISSLLTLERSIEGGYGK